MSVSKKAKTKKSTEPKYEESYLVAPYVPQEISDVEAAFPAHALKWMPKFSEIPDGFRGADRWECRLFGDLFYQGLADLKLIPKDGIDPEKAWRHLRAVMGSYEPKHEHKEAAVAFLLNQWFESATWTVRVRK